MAKKRYGVTDVWPDDKITNVVEFESTDGAITGAWINGIPAGGGGTTVKLVKTGTVTIEEGDTSTTQTLLDTYTVDPNEFELDGYIVVKIRKDVIGPSIYAGMDAVSVKGQNSGAAAGVYMAYRYNNNGTRVIAVGQLTSPNGVYPNISNVNGYDVEFKIYKKYSSSFTPNWSGTYTVEIYSVHMPDQIAPAPYETTQPEN